MPDPLPAKQRGVWVAIYIGIVAATFAAVLPMLVGVLASSMGLGATRAGYVVALDRAGSLVGTFTALWMMRRRGWATTMRVFLPLLMFGNLASGLTTSYGALLPLRLLTGLSEGGAVAIAYAIMGASTLPERSLAWYCAGQMVVGALGSLAIPYLVNVSGWPAPFFALAALAAPALFVIRLLPEQGDAAFARPARGATKGGLSPAAWAGMGSVLLYFVGAGALFAYLERLGNSLGIAAQTVAWSIAASNVVGLCGSLLAGSLARWVGRRRGASVGALLTVIAIAALCMPGLGAPAFAAATCLLMFAWNVFYPFQFGLLAGADRAGVASGITPALTGSGLALGPALAAFVLTQHGYESVALLSLLIVLASFPFLWPAARRSP